MRINFFYIFNYFKNVIIKMSENNNVMTTITKNPVVIIGIVVFVVVSIVLIVKMRGSEEAFSASNIFDDTFNTSDDTFDTFNTSDTSDKIVENFTQSTPMNVMYSDAAGNLATTTDLGLQNLTIGKDGALLLGNKFRFNANKDAHADDEWLRMMNPGNTGYSGGFAAGKLYGASVVHSDGTMYSRGELTAGSIKTDGAVSAGTIRSGSTISTSTGYGIIDNRSVKPNQLPGGHVQFGFGSLANNGTAPFADTIHLNGWGDASGQRPNLVMFDKSKPGMRIYQGDWNSGAAYTTYNDAVMADSGGNASVSGVLTSTSAGVSLNGANLSVPSANTRINSQGIIFGGANNGRQADSAQITAGKHDADALCIVGMSKEDHSSRRIRMWAEGGTRHDGPMDITGGLTVAGRNILAELDAIKATLNVVKTDPLKCMKRSTYQRNNPDVNHHWGHRSLGHLIEHGLEEGRSKSAIDQGCANSY
jgi:hypothetical protein